MGFDRLAMGQAAVTHDDEGSGFQSGYRSVFRFPLRRNETAASVAEFYMRDWLGTRKRGADARELDQWDGTGDLSLPSGTEVQSVDFEDKRGGRSAVRYRATDDADTGHYRVSVTAFTSRKRQRDVALLVEVARDVGTQEDAVARTHPPRIVPAMLNDRRAMDGDTRLQGVPRAIGQGDLDELLTAVADGDREAPLIVASSPSAHADERWRRVVGQLTKDAVGTAAVYAVAAGAVEELNQRLPEPLRVEPGQMRTIAPRVNLENPVMRRHPLWTAEELAAALDDKGVPLPEATQQMALAPRLRLLGAVLPPDLRRMTQLLDKAERQKDLEERVEEAVAVVLSEPAAMRVPEPAAELAKPDVSAQAGPEVPGRFGVEARRRARFPRRSELHATGSGSDFWPSFRALIAKWLGKVPEEVSPASVESDIRALDVRITREREAAAVKEVHLNSIVRERDDLLVQVAELKDEGDSLAAQLEASQAEVAALNQAAEAMRGQLEELEVAVVAPEQNGMSSEGLADLQQKLSQAARSLGESRDEVGEALGLLGEHLEPILQEALAGYLDGLEWTAVLRQLDVAKGREPGTYRAADPAAQLRMLTEPLGKLGYFFEVDNLRTVSTTAQQLRALRNRWAHYDVFEPWDVVQAYGSVYQLLSALEDTDGALRAQEKMNQVQLGYALGETLEDLQGSDVAPIAPDLATTTGSASPPTDDAAEPSEAVMVRADGEETPLVGEGRLPYVPWPVSSGGSRETLDELSVPKHQELVQSVVEEIVDFEGPVSLGRLIGLVGAEFGLKRVQGSRRGDIEGQIRRASVRVDGDGFVWPERMDPAGWAEFRPTGSDVPREFADVSPVEIRNAARFILERRPWLAGEDLEREILQTFGRRRLTSQVRKRMGQSLGPEAQRSLLV